MTDGPTDMTKPVVSLGNFASHYIGVRWTIMKDAITFVVTFCTTRMSGEVEV